MPGLSNCARPGSDTIPPSSHALADTKSIARPLRGSVRLDSIPPAPGDRRSVARHPNVGADAIESLTSFEDPNLPAPQTVRADLPAPTPPRIECRHEHTAP